MVRHYTVLVSKDTVLILYEAPSFCIGPVLALFLNPYPLY